LMRDDRGRIGSVAVEKKLAWPACHNLPDDSNFIRR
jgi:hypothetical protein